MDCTHVFFTSMSLRYNYICKYSYGTNLCSSFFWYVRYSGWFYRHPLIRNYTWYWRVEPGVDFFCDVTYDPFVYLEKTGKKYGFTIGLTELMQTIPSLWTLTEYFMAQEGISRDQGNESPLIHYFQKDLEVPPEDKTSLKKEKSKKQKQQKSSLNRSPQRGVDSGDQPDGHTGDLDDFFNTEAEEENSNEDDDDTQGAHGFYNGCHFWSNFEIARTDLWNGELYTKVSSLSYFEILCFDSFFFSILFF